MPYTVEIKPRSSGLPVSLRRPLAIGIGGAVRVFSRILQCSTGCFVPCRFEPSCSVYTEQAISRFGLWKGLSLSAQRVSRCRPGAPWGMDPLPKESF